MAPFLDQNVNGFSKSAQPSLEDKSMPIAIVGMSFRGPGSANSVENLWNMICEKREARAPIPRSKWNNDAFYHPNFERHGTHNVEYGHFFEGDVSKFDAPFFNLTRTEAAALDPAQRLLLECTYEALENGGIPMEKICGTKTSVFVGSFATDYTDLLTRDPETVPMYQCTNSGQSRAMAANRLSYFFDFHGPSVTVDTACSGSLVALHLACQSLRTGEAKSAICAGVNVILNHELMITMSMMRFLSPDGRCYTFDERGNGYARGEGVGTVFLKPLADALRDGDTIRAIIRDSGSNQDGKTSGITLPNPVAQETLIRDVYASAGLDPLETSFVEAHGTGTSAGDPLEARALSNVFCGPDRPGERPLMIGSIKSNVGHMEGASGIGAVVKAVLMLEQEVILPNRNFEKPNPRIPLEEWNLKVATDVEPWTTSGPARVSINSFGYGGSNAHVILESARTYLNARALSGTFRKSGTLRRYLADPACNVTVHGKANGNTDGTATNGVPTYSNRNPKLFMISAFDKPGGQRQVKALTSHIRKRAKWESSDFLDDLAFTLNERRTEFLWKATLVVSSATELIDALSKPVQFSRSFKNPVLGFVFTGQGAQWCGMGKELLAAYPVFKSMIIRIGMYLQSIQAPFNVEEEILKDPKLSQINTALYSQTMCSAIQIALIELLASWGIRPTSVTGHSSGEIASAYAIGALSLEDAMAVAYYRGLCSAKMQEKSEIKGAMIAVGISEEDVTPLLADLRAGRAVVASVNSPSSVTISGDRPAVDELQKKLESKGIFARKLAVEVAYHSHHMKLVAEDYSASISGITVRQGNGIKFYSSVFGREAAAVDLGPSYWVANLLGQVRFAESLRQLCLTTSGAKKRRQSKVGDVNALIEIGPHSALASPITQILQADLKLKEANVAYFSALVRKTDATKTTLDLAGKLAVAGQRLNFSAINRPAMDMNVGVLVDLPPYSWNHSTSYWAEPRRSKALRKRRFPRVDILGVRDESSNPLQLSWHNYLRVSEIPWLRQHRIQSSTVFPGMGFIAIAIEAAAQGAKERSAKFVSGFTLREITIQTALIVQEQGAVETVVTLKPVLESARHHSDLWNEFHIFSVTDDDNWTEHCRGLISVQTEVQEDHKSDEELASTISAIQDECKRKLPMGKFYEHLRGIGLDYGEVFANIMDARVAANKAVAVLQVPDTAETMPMGREHQHTVHPATLDAVLHAGLGALSSDTWLENPAVPIFISSLFVSKSIPSNAGQLLRVQANVLEKDNQAMKTDITVMRPNSSTPVVQLSNMVWKFLPRDDVEKDTFDDHCVAYALRWEPDVDLLGHRHARKIRQSAAEYMRLLGYKNPDLSVLDASGSEYITLSILEALRGEDSNTRPRFKTYTVLKTQQSASIAESDALGTWRELISTKEFDLEVDPASQGFQLNAYDVMSLTISHASAPSLRKVFAIARNLLRANGRLIIFSEDRQRDGSIPYELHSWLHETGFAGFDKDMLGSTTQEDNEQSLIVAQVAQEKRFDGSNILLIASDDSRRVDADLLADMLAHDGGNVTQGNLYDADPAEKICVILDIAGKILSNPTARQFDMVKSIFTQSENVLWVTSGGAQPFGNPEANMVTGLARTARTEKGTARIVTLDLDGEDRLPPEGATHTIFSILKACFVIHEEEGLIDSEFSERRGTVNIPRLIADNVLNETLESFVNPPAVEVQLHQQAHHRLRLPDSTGSANNFLFEEEQKFSGDLGTSEIEIEVKAISLDSRSDVEMAVQDISGVVTRVGNNVEDLSPGDRVFGIGSGVVSTVYQGRAKAFQKIPNAMPFETAASIPTAYSTAFYAAYHLGRVSTEDTVLIQSATSPLGQALIAVCKRVGAAVYAGVSTNEQKVFLETTLRVRKDRIIYNADSDFTAEILKKTNGHGIDVIFNTLRGEGLRLSWNCTAPYGRFVELNTQNAAANTRLEMRDFKKNTTFAALDFHRLKTDKPRVVDKVWVEVARLVHERKLIPADTKKHLFNVERLGDAVQCLRKGKVIGDVVVVFNPSDRVKIIPANASKALFRDDASYLLVGGLGGIGRATALWMVDRGAKNIIFANRSGMSKQDAKDTVATVKEKGARAYVQQCDVSEPAQVRKLVEECSTLMPPIRGVIQGAMVLRDTLLDKLMVSDYNAVVQPKVQGTWNLHNYLPKDMDFFIMLSSVSGIIGNATQSAYAAANTFMDAFAGFRNAQGLPAVTLDLGAISGVGYLATDESKVLLESMKRQGFSTTSEKLLMALIQSAIVTPHRQAESSQTVTGLGSWKRGQSLPALDGPLFAHLRRLSPDSDGDGRVSKDSDGVKSAKVALRLCSTLDDATTVICTELIGYLAARSSIPAENFSTGRTITEYGVDSIVAVELRNWIAHELDSTVPILELLANDSLHQLSAKIASRSKSVNVDGGEQ